MVKETDYPEKSTNVCQATLCHTRENNNNIHSQFRGNPEIYGKGENWYIYIYMYCKYI